MRPDGAKQRVVLHVARADLDAVGHFGDEVRAFFVERFGDDRQPRLAARQREQLESALAQVPGTSTASCAA